MNMTFYENEAGIRRCFPLMKALRRNLAGETEFLAQVWRQQGQGYRLTGLECDGKPVTLAGFRPLENFIHGRFFYIDDLVTAPDYRGRGLGESLLAAIADLARRQGLDRVVLDTALVNSQAQKFYARAGYIAVGLHYYQPLDKPAGAAGGTSGPEKPASA